MSKTTSTSPSDWELSRRMERCPGSVPLFSDQQLCHLVGQFGEASDPLYAEALLGELLARRWLYVEDSMVVQKFDRLLGQPDLMDKKVLSSFHAHLLPYRQAPSSAIEGGVKKFAETGNVAEAACRRIRTILEADGLIALVTADGNCVGVPFRFDHEVKAGEISDAAGAAPENWEADTKALASAMKGDKGVRLCCALGSFNKELHGGSFALPVLLAWKLDIRSICDYPALKLLATGAVESDRICSVDGIPCKRELARRMGLRFIAPMAAKEKEAGDIAITSGVSIEKAVSAADKKLSPLIADNLRPAKICRRLEDLDTEIHKGKISRIHAEELMERYGHLLANHPADDYAREGQRLLRLLEAAIANHAGDPKTAEQFVGQALEYTDDGETKSKLLSRLIVSLTDSGQLDEAARRAKELLVLVDSAPWKLLKLNLLNQCKMRAHGVYGGQVLLNRALQGEVSPAGSRWHLEQNLSYA